MLSTLAQTCNTHVHTHVHVHTHTLPVPSQRMLPAPPPNPHLLQLAEVFTLPQQLAQWLHMLLAEAAACERAGGGGTSCGCGVEPLRVAGSSWVWPPSSCGASPRLRLPGTNQHPQLPPPPQQIPRGTHMLPLGRWFSKWELVEMQILGTQPRPTASETLGARLTLVQAQVGEL